MKKALLFLLLSTGCFCAQAYPVELQYELQRNPQQFGQTILHLQELIETATIELEKTPSNAQLRTFLKENTLQLQQRLAVVKLLESPN